jgi:hypothetical protein
MTCAAQRFISINGLRVQLQERLITHFTGNGGQMFREGADPLPPNAAYVFLLPAQCLYVNSSIRSLLLSVPADRSGSPRQRTGLLSSLDSGEQGRVELCLRQASLHQPSLSRWHVIHPIGRIVCIENCFELC